ncbi:MAG: nucleotidyltransferase family protein [Candidatus Cryptobacteroides sp.]
MSSIFRILKNNHTNTFSKPDIILLNLLRTTISGAETESETFFGISGAQWREVFKLSQRQGVCAVALEGVEHLPADCRPPKDVLLEWIGQSFAIETHYNKHLCLAKELAGKWAVGGIRTMVFKGLAHSRYYPVPSHREFGDFDCYLFCADFDPDRKENDAFEIGNRLARVFGAEVDDGWYKHSKICYKELTVENHQYFTATRSSSKAKELNAYMVATLGDGAQLEKSGNSEILLPPIEAEGLFMLYHSQMHFLVEGITLRHFVDWACWIKSNQNKIVWNDFYIRCKQFGLEHFAAVSNAIAEDYFGIALNEGITKDGTYSEKVILSALYDDSAIYNRSKGRWYERFHLISNAFKYSWKFREVTHYNLWEYLWSYVRGFIFRDEE